MGPQLQAEVESQLLKDLATYGVDIDRLKFDWSEACQEGHCTTALDGNFEEVSDVRVMNLHGELVAEGWIDFIHGGGNNPLFVFWLFLTARRDGKWIRLKTQPHIPAHIWAQLPYATKRLCSYATEYDARWTSDPTVLAWKRSHPA